MDNAPVRPPYRYYGGKQRLAPTIVGHLPPHTTYVEVFGGSAAVLLAKPRSRREVYNDLDAGVVNFYAVLRARGDELRHLCALTPHSRTQYLADRVAWQEALARGDTLEAARAWYTAITQSFARTTGKDGWSNSHPRTTGLDRFEAVAQRLLDVTIECLPFERLIPLYDGPDTVFYCDPPYMPTVAAAKYRHTLTIADHERLLALLTSVQGQVMLSGYPHPLYEQTLTTWQRHTRVLTCQVAAAERKSKRTEVLWVRIHPAPTLFALPTALRPRAEDRASDRSPHVHAQHAS